MLGSYYCRGLKWERGAEPADPLTLTTEADCLPHIERILQELPNSCSIRRLQHGPTVDYRTLFKGYGATRDRQ